MCRKFIALTIGVLLTGCAAVQQQRLEAAITSFNAESETVCRKGEKLTRKNALERQRCLANLFIPKIQAAGYPYMPLAHQFVAANHQAAVMFAEGKISEEQFHAATQSNYADMLSAEQNLAMQQQQRQSEAWFRTSQYLQQMQHQQMMNRPVQTNCINTGMGVNCTSW